jgi:hypothetical protein
MGGSLFSLSAISDQPSAISNQQSAISPNAPALVLIADR